MSSTDPHTTPISYEALVDGLTDPDVEIDSYMPYLIEVRVDGRMAPELQPNPAFVTGIPPGAEGGVGMGFANWFMRRRRHRKYRKLLRSGWTGPRLVSEGDSWFQYPTRLKDIIDHLMEDHAILSLGAAGDELSDMRAQREILVNMQEERASALLLSAGGNDLFDNGQLGNLIEAPFPGATGRELVGSTFDEFVTALIDQLLFTPQASPHGNASRSPGPPWLQPGVSA